jgi:hypothetical protein
MPISLKIGWTFLLIFGLGSLIWVDCVTSPTIGFMTFINTIVGAIVGNTIATIWLED